MNATINIKKLDVITSALYGSADGSWNLYDSAHDWLVNIVATFINDDAAMGIGYAFYDLGDNVTLTINRDGSTNIDNPNL